MAEKKAIADALICTVDVVLLTLHEQQLQVALIEREHAPFEGALALPGGYVRTAQDRSTTEAAVRVLREKAALASPWLEQLGSFSGPERDPRGWSLSVAYYALVPAALLEGQPGLQLRPVARLPRLPFDHRAIIEAAVARVRTKSQYSSLPVHLCGETFTLPQLQAVYEALLGEPINKVSFRRKIDQLGMVEPVEGAQELGRANRPAQLYRLRRAFRQKLSLLERGLNARN
ncbi:NUDIX hydrolase [Pelomonas sp. KK5]|uniref:NUDIX hydrolase n=1 Tax=Pelomonas sp. KK5 TaxID=1855730 RepID=UPI00097C84AC|nr:NUDIX hydrolase [Pelomonas sp. KK5]